MVMTVAAAASRLAEACDYSSLGPCLPLSSLATTYHAKDPAGNGTRLSLKVTIPGQVASIPRPYPILFFFNGFQVGCCTITVLALHLVMATICDYNGL